MDALSEAVEEIKKLPIERQMFAADVLKHIAASSETFTVPEAHRAAILEGRAQGARGEFVSDEEIAALWARCGV